MRIEVKIELSKENCRVYEFNTFDLNVVFVGYREQNKPKGKRLWKTISFWDKYNERDSNIKESPFLPLEVKQKAFEEMMKVIKVMTWEQWKNPKVTP